MIMIRSAMLVLLSQDHENIWMIDDDHGIEYQTDDLGLIGRIIFWILRRIGVFV